MTESMDPAPGQCGSAGRTSSHKPKSCGFSSQSGHMPGLGVQSLIGVCTGGNQLLFLCHIDVSLPLFLPLFPSLESIKEKN